MSSSQKTFLLYLFTFTLGAILILPELVTQDMFSDGLLYGLLGRNLAIGKGSFWDPMATETFFKSFREHPPLVFGMESLLFRLLGDSIYVERLYSFLTLIFSVTAMHQIWELTNSIFNFAPKKTSWFPILLYFLVPNVTWSFQNNLLENTLSVFTLYAVYFQIRSLISTTRIGQWGYLLISAALLVGGVLTKGVVALFPLAVAGLFWISTKRITFKKILSHSLLLLLVSFFFLSLMLIPHEAQQFVREYLDQQLLSSLAGDREIVSNRFFSLYILLENLGIIVLISGVLFLFTKKKTAPFNSPTFIFFLSVGLSASLPLLISPKQLSFYTVPSFPYFALALAAFSIHFTMHYVTALPIKFWNGLRVFIPLFMTATIILTIVFKDKVIRNPQELSDINKIITIIPEETIIMVDDDLFHNYPLHYYFYRLNRISLSLEKSKAYNFTLQRKEESVPVGFELHTKMSFYSLLKRIEE